MHRPRCSAKWPYRWRLMVDLGRSRLMMAVVLTGAPQGGVRVMLSVLSCTTTALSIQSHASYFIDTQKVVQRDGQKEENPEVSVREWIRAPPRRTARRSVHSARHRPAPGPTAIRPRAGPSSPGPGR